MLQRIEDDSHFEGPWIEDFCRLSLNLA